MNRITPSNIYHFIYGSAFFAVLICTVWLYWGGLGGIYLLDDEPNLDELASIHSLTGFGKFVTEGHSSHLGRPLSLFTFALQAHNWQSNPWSFKYVNLMIHLLNGCLVFWLIFYLMRLMKFPERRSLLLALLTASLWLWHPLQVSTVLYVVQRMTQLSTFFTLAGLLLYLYGRQKLAQNQLKAGFWWVSVGVGLGEILATLSKENGILLVLYIIVLEITVLHTLPKPRYWRVWCWGFLYLPLFLLAFYFATHISSLLGAYEIRDFTMGERLLTQARVLSDYLSKILFPHPNAFGLFQDDFPISHHLFAPPTTLMAVGFILMAFIAAIRLRRTIPVFSVGFLWFLAGHVLESSFIGLVIAFEHRNYLPSLGIMFAVIYGLLWLFNWMLNHHLRKIVILLSVLWLTFAPIITWLETDLWGKPVMQAVLWAKQKPLSRYAQSQAAVVLIRTGNFTEAEKYYRQMIKVFPQDSSPYLLWLATVCLNEQVKLPNIEQVIDHLKTSKIDIATPSALTTIATQYAEGQCHRFSANTIHRLFKVVLNNPTSVFYEGHIYLRYGYLYASEQNYDKAALMAKKALLKNNSPHIKIQHIFWLIKANRFEEALFSIKQMRDELNTLSSLLYANELDVFERLAIKLQKIFQEIEQNSALEEPQKRPFK